MAHKLPIVEKDFIQSTAVITTVEQEMKELYAQILSEPIPNRFLLVLKDLETKEKEKILH